MVDRAYQSSPEHGKQLVRDAQRLFDPPDYVPGRNGHAPFNLEDPRNRWLQPMVED